MCWVSEKIMEKQLCKEACMKEVNIVPHLYTVCIHSMSLVSLFSLSLLCLTTVCKHVYASISVPCVDMQEATNMSRTVVLTVMVDLCW